MLSTIGNLRRLAWAGMVLGWHGARLLPDHIALPGPGRVVRRLTAPLRWGRRADRGQGLSAALTSLGPSYIKLGQFMATRADVIGPELARDLAGLQDRLPPFPQKEAIRAVENALNKPVSELFIEFGPPVAAASIAQVHKARVRDADGRERAVAVKILRPGVEARFARDLESYYFAARLIERAHPPSRRLRPIAVVDTLARSVELEMDLRLEAAALSEMAENTRDDEGFRVPAVDWDRTAKRVLTIEWVDGIPINNRAALEAAGHDLTQLGNDVIRHFLRHAMRDGFFHADMHQGNLFVDPAGTLVAIDFGIVGRINPEERRFLAEILHGFITRNYRRIAEIHFEAGYVPPTQDVEVFAQAMRAIGEPLQGKSARDISMAGLIGQLFEYTAVFDMATRTELIMLQKSMVITEGVARSLDPNINIWTAAEPVVREWIARNLGPVGRLEDATEGVSEVGRLALHLPKVLRQAETTAAAFRDMLAGGLRLDQASLASLAELQRGRGGRWALWVIALALSAIAAALGWQTWMQ